MSIVDDYQEMQTVNENGDVVTALVPINAVVDAARFLSKQRALLRRWLLYADEIPSPSSDEAKAINDWPKHVGTDQNARIAAALVVLKASGSKTDAYSVITCLDRREELIGAGGVRYIIDLVSPSEATQQIVDEHRDGLAILAEHDE